MKESRAERRQRKRRERLLDWLRRHYPDLEVNAPAELIDAAAAHLDRALWWLPFLGTLTFIPVLIAGRWIVPSFKVWGLPELVALTATCSLIGFVVSPIQNWFTKRRERKLIGELLVDHLRLPICARCGYDCRGQTTPRCPECGADLDPELLTVQARPAADAATREAQASREP